MIEPEDMVGYLDHEPLNGEPKFKAQKADMKIELELVIWPDETLKHPVRNFPEADLGSRLVKNTAGAMIKAMYKYHGIGLAAQQVGVPFQIFVMDPGWHDEKAKKQPRVFLNPVVVNIGDGRISVPAPGEGCLSFPYKYRAPVQRFAEIELEWYDFHGCVQREWFEGFPAIVVQHEMDHLNGFCFIDHLSPLKYDIAIRKARKIRSRYKKGFQKTLKAMKNAPRTKEYNAKRQQMFEEGYRTTKEAAE
jgi:peptide deformylase